MRTINQGRPPTSGMHTRVGMVLCRCATERAARPDQPDNPGDVETSLVVRAHNDPATGQPCPGTFETFAWSDLIAPKEPAQ